MNVSISSQDINNINELAKTNEAVQNALNHLLTVYLLAKPANIIIEETAESKARIMRSILKTR